MRADRVHTLLPWYVNGTLEPNEHDEFERHLVTCPPCRDELGKVAAMRAETARHGEAFFSEHPAPEILGALFGVGEGPLDAAAEETVRRHLAVCATCSDESRWLTGAEIAEGLRSRAIAADTVSRGGLDDAFRASSRIGPPAASAPQRVIARPFVMRLWPAVAGAALAVLATIFVPGPWRRGPGSGPVAHGFLEPTRRTGAAIAEVLVRPEHKAIVLDIPSQLTPSQLPARIEILDATGTTVHREEGLYPAGPAGELFTIVVPNAALPPGDYVARLEGAAPVDEPPTEFPFRIVIEAP